MGRIDGLKRHKVDVTFVNHGTMSSVEYEGRAFLYTRNIYGGSAFKSQPFGILLKGQNDVLNMLVQFDIELPGTL